MATTEERIIEAAEKLEAEGVNPTQVTVREALGGGSFATIGPILKKWKESKKQDSELAEIQVPEAITERLDQLQGAVWQAAVAEADRRLVAEREALHQAQESAAAEIREHQESVKALEVEAEDYHRKIEALEEAVRKLDFDRRNAEAEAAELKIKLERDRAAMSEALLKETERKDAAMARAERAERLHQETVEQSRVDLEALKNEHKSELSALKADYQERIERVRAEAANRVLVAEQQAASQTERAEKAEKEAQKRSAGEQACQSRLEAAQREIENMFTRMSKLEDKADNAIEEAAELRGELRALRNSSQP